VAKFFENKGGSDRKKLNIYNYPSDSVPDFPESVYRSRMMKINQKTPFKLDYNEYVRAYINLYAFRKRNITARVLGLAEYYFPMFEEVLAKYNIPLELKYLAIIESALNPNAKSKAGAMGLWQFMYRTGQMYGLEVNSYIDERSDPDKATEAAAKYLSYLYKMYNNWHLALAAYNAGPGNVNKAIRRSGGKTDYWELRPFLPKETAGYVPAFIAVNYVMAYHKEHNIYPNKPKYYNYEVDSITVKAQVTFQQISTLLGISIEDLRFLNPSYIKDVIPYREQGYSLYLPKKYMGTFMVNADLIRNYSKPEQGPDSVVVVQATTDAGETKEAKIVHTVKKGEYLSTIARLYQVKVSDVVEWNKLKSNYVYVGQKLTIYTSGAPVATQASTTENNPSTQNNKDIIHVVKAGETLFAIAKKYNVSVEQIQQWNNIKNGNTINIGDKLVIKS
jgi:membrane-bound lytic murein transglycosylase D